MAIPRIANYIVSLLPPRRVPRLLILVGVLAFLLITTGFFQYDHVAPHIIKAGKATDGTPSKPPPILMRKPESTAWVPPPIQDPFPSLESEGPPPVPKWNVAPPNLYKQYNLTVAPPLLIGFTRNYPMLLQAVVSYITAGWPPEYIYVVENTGVQRSNQRGLLTLQNPYYLNHKALKKLGVNIVITPTLLSFAQLQNFYHAMSYDHEWPYYFWSHMDIVAFSFEDDQVTPAITKPGYKSLYELSLQAVQKAQEQPKWGLKFFAYDHYSLVNAAMVENIGGWDTFIPYYSTDCDYHARVRLAGWTIEDAVVGIFTDIGSTFSDLRALYRVPGVNRDLRDPNPPPPSARMGRRDNSSITTTTTAAAPAPAVPAQDADLEYWRTLVATGDKMLHLKHDAQHTRLGWQQSQRGGFGEPFYYPPEGIIESIDVLIEAGRNVFGRKWGVADCAVLDHPDSAVDGGLKLWDQWKVKKLTQGIFGNG